MKIIIFMICITYSNAIEFPWMYYLPYGNLVTLKPLFRNASDRPTISSCKWTTPKQIDLYPENPTYDQLRYKIDKSTCELTIYNIQKDTNGIYHCTINDFYVSKAMLNVHGAPKASLLEEYTPNLIAGFSTAGGIIAFFAFTCGIYKFRYREPLKLSNSNESSEINNKVTNYYKNQSYEKDDEEEDNKSEDLRSIRI